MLDTIFTIPVPFGDGGLEVHGYGLMLVVGFFAALEIAKRTGGRVGIKIEFWQNALLIAVVTGVLGSRLSHVLENLDVYTDPERSAWANFVAAVNLTSGGLTFYGGLILAALCLIGYTLWQKVPLRLAMDAGAPAVMVGLAFGRIGCFFHGCCEGAACSLPWAVRFPYGSLPMAEQAAEGKVEVPAALIRDGRLVSESAAAADPMLARLAEGVTSLPLHPTQLYSSLNAFLLTALLLAYFFTPHRPGRVFALMLILNGGTRFVLELLRTEPAVATIGGIGFSFSMIGGLALSAVGVVLWFVFRNGEVDPSRPVEADEPAATAAPAAVAG